MDDWNERADQLEAALLADPKALVLHFLKTATPEQIEALASAHDIETDKKAFTSTKFLLVTRLEKRDAEIEALLACPTTSFWLRHSLEQALDRDCVDAANDAEQLNRLLAARCKAIEGVGLGKNP